MGATPLHTIERYLAAVRAGDWERAFAFFHPEVRFRIPGRSALAGEHAGRAAAMAYINAARALSGEHDVEVEVVDVLSSAERVVLLLCERFGQAGGPVEIRRANAYRVRDDRIVEIWIYEADQHVVDALFGAGPAG